MNRRSFLKLLGASTAAIVAAPLLPASAAPLYIPSDRLEMGVPHEPKIHLATLEETMMVREGKPFQLLPQSGKTVPLMILHDNFMPGYGGRVKAGSIILESESVAARWVKRGIALRAEPTASPLIVPGRDWGKHGAMFLHDDWGRSYTVNSKNPENYIETFYSPCGTVDAAILFGDESPEPDPQYTKPVRPKNRLIKAFSYWEKGDRGTGSGQTRP